jgi:hypothetical protein
MPIFKPLAICLVLVASSLFISESLQAQGQPSEDSSRNQTQPYLDDIYGPTFKSKSGISGGFGITNTGFSANISYLKLYSPDLIGFASFSVTSAGDENEREVFDPFTGQSISLNRQESMLIFPLTFGVQQRLLRESIESSLRPFIEIGLGPSLGYVTPYEDGFFGGFSKGQANWGANGYIGVGAYFGTNPESIQGLTFRYQFNYFSRDVKIITDTPRRFFGNISITLLFGTFF